MTYVDALIDLFVKTPDMDITISKMHEVLYGPSLDVFNVRHMQQKLAPIIRRANAKLPLNHKIEPGMLKRTYRLNTNVRVVH